MDTYSQPLSRFTAQPIWLHAWDMPKNQPPANGEAIKKSREAKGLTQDELGATLVPSCSKQQIYKWETGRLSVKLKTAEQLAGILGGDPLQYVSDGNAPEDSKRWSIAALASLDIEILAAGLEPVLASFDLDTEDARDTAQHLIDVFQALHDASEGEIAPRDVRNVAVGALRRSSGRANRPAR